MTLGLLGALVFTGCATSSGGQRTDASGSAIPGVPAGISFGGGNGLDCGQRVIVQELTDLVVV